jgi:hypothetical protein
MANERPAFPRNERQAFRVSPNSGVPIRFWVSINDLMVSPVVEELGVTGARLMTVKHFDEFHEGQLLGPGSLHLEDIGTVEVSAVVKWKAFPRIGIEFFEMGVSRQDKLFQYLFKVSRQAIRIELSRREIERS